MPYSLGTPDNHIAIHLHTSEGVVQCQGQNPHSIIAVLSKPVGFPQISSIEIVKMFIKLCMILVSILWRDVSMQENNIY